jgi:uncharacterized protein (DUF488 family)
VKEFSVGIGSLLCASEDSHNTFLLNVLIARLVPNSHIQHCQVNFLMKQHLYTLGYEGLDIETFLGRLNAAKVNTVVDVRELPLSRKKGFSKSSFSAALSEHGIAYLHVPALGCPKPIRHQYKADGNWRTYTKEFLAYVAAQEAPIQELVKISRATTACLVCYEADFSMCHRTFVARAARQHGGPTVMHLTAKTALPDLGFQQAA